MRWAAKPKGLYHPWFAFFPLRSEDGTMTWLEPIWVHDTGLYVEWARWEARPNDAIRAAWKAARAAPQPSPVSVGGSQ